MMKQLKNFLLKKRFSGRLPGVRLGESGQSLIILAFAFMGLLAMLGLALDMGLVYIERVRLKRTIDAAVLAAVSELPAEEEAARRAMDFLKDNGYDLSTANVYIAGCVQDVNDLYNTAGTTDDLVNLPDQSELDKLAADEALSPGAPLDPLTPDNTKFYPYIINGSRDEVTSFFIDTRSFQDRVAPDCDSGVRVSDGVSGLGGASKLRIYAEVPVRMSFMQFFGFSSVDVGDSAIAENAASLDVAVVLDTTGSMEYDTICFGCWARCSESGKSPWSEGWSNSRFIPTSGDGSCGYADRYEAYPANGRSFPFPYPRPPSDPDPLTGDEDRMLTLITGNGGDATVWPPVAGEPKASTIGSTKYILLEAEFYKNNFSSWDPGARLAGKGYWAIQRNRTAKAYAIDGYGYGGRTNFSNDYLSGLVRHHPFYEENGGNPFGHCYTQTDAKKNIAPRLDYDFIPGWSTTTYIYIRALYFNYNDCTALGSTAAERRSVIYWAVDDGEPAMARAERKSGSQEANFGTNGLYGWIALPAVNLGSADVRHTLKIWAGSPGVSLDRIIITDQSSVSSPEELRDLAATPGSAQGLAKDPCNPIFGLTVFPDTDCTYREDLYEPTNNLTNPIFNDIDPIRGAQEAIRGFIARLDPQLDQAGLVDFAGDGWQRAQLECLRASRARENSGDGAQPNYPLNSAIYPEYDELNCNDLTKGTTPISYTNVFVSIEDTNPPGGNTDIADGLRRGLHMLGYNTDNDDSQKHSNDCVWDWRSSQWQMPTKTGWDNVPGLNDASPIISHCGRGQAATSIIVLLTDGAPTNSNPGDNSDCTGWGAANTAPYEGFPMTDNKYECIMYYADLAANNGVIVYAIGLGAGADRDLLEAVAERTNGQAYFVLTSSQLDAIFDQILTNVYIRLIQ